jgi:uncharacterized membrane protein
MGHLTLVTLHLLAAITWAGGIAFLALVGAPVLRHVDDAALRQRLFNALGQRFRVVGWLAVGVAVLSGTALLAERGLLAAMGDAGFWATAAGHALGVKLVALVAMLGINGWHDLVDGPRASAAVPGTPAAVALRQRSMRLARAGAVAALVVVVAGVWLSRR